MIGRIEGVLLEQEAPHLLVDVSGVGYDLQAPLSTVFVLPALGQRVRLHTHLAVREDAHQLFAFATKIERSLFRALIKTSGVGAKMALAILSAMEPAHFIRSIKDKDMAMLVKIPGVGKKTAERLMVEMADRLQSIDEALPTKAAHGLPVSINMAVEDAEKALVNLGYKPQQAARAIAKVDEEGMSPEQLIKAALKQI